MQISTPSRPSSIATISRGYTPSPLSPAALPSNGSVRITYTLAQSLQSSPHSAALLESLRSRLQPLRNLHWRPSAGTLPGSSIRTVQSLDAEMIPLDVGLSSARLSTAEGFGMDGGRSQIPSSVLGKPFINLWLGMCEDADTYKNVVRRQLKDWVASVTSQSKRDQEWLIVLVTVSSPGQDSAGSSGKRLFQMKGSIIDRMRADFTLAKRDRCVQLNYVSAGQEDPAAWTDLIAKIKEAIVTTLDGRVAERMDDVRRTEAQRAVPGWNFCTFFVLKESIAESFEGMTLLDAALIQYSELEASFYQVLKEKNLSWFGKLGGTAPGDDAAPLLSVSKKPYRDLILSNTISVFDFRCYLLARQCLLLAKMGAIAEAATKANRFISSFARTLRENENSLSEPFLESWMYSCALNVVDECDAWLASASGQESTSDSKGLSYSAAKCELLELARAQLDKIGIRAGHLPRTVPFTTSLPDQPSKSRPTSASFDPHAPVVDPEDAEYRRLSRAGVTNAALLQAMSNASEFDELYKQTVTRTIDTCNASGRSRTVSRLQGVLAALHLHRGELPDAQSIYSELPSQYIEQYWTFLESYMRAQHLAATKSIGETRTEAWLHHALAFLKATLALSVDEGSGTLHTEQILRDVLEVADGLSSDLLVNDFLPLDIRVVDDTAGLDNKCDGSTIEVIVNSNLPINLDVKEIKMLLSGRDGCNIIFKSEPTQVPPGQSNLTLRCPDPVSGLFTTAEHEYQISRLLFKSPSPDSIENSLFIKHSLSVARAIVRVPNDRRSVRLDMQTPRHVVLGDPKVIFRIFTGRNNLKTGTFTVESSGNQIKYALESAKVLSEASGAISCTKSRVKIEDVPADHELVISVPYTGSPRNDELEGTLVFVYMTVAQPELIRTVKTGCRAYVGLPLIVNINDKFRNQRLFTNVVVHSANQELVRVAKVTLSNTTPESKLSVKHCNRSPIPVVVRPSRPAPFLFQILASDAKEPPTGETLQLVISYRSIHEDLKEIVERAVDLATHNSTHERSRKEQRNIIQNALLGERVWLDMFESVRHSPTGDRTPWAQRLVDRAPVKLDLDSVTTTVESMRKVDSESQSDSRDERCEWRTVTMPFDVPLMNIVNRVRMTPQLDPDVPKYAGQPVDVAVTIAACFHWNGSNENAEEKHPMRYDVVCDMDSGWLVSGPKRGEYTAQDGTEHTVSLTLLPLRHGSLPLPIINVEPIDSTEGGRRLSCETWQADGAQKVTVLPRNARSTYVVAMPVSFM
ncbi:hypothetical protein BDV93DRAFT_220356 [Ceratobasidium sp. AG-I]|nr:hypothetical protein BDV93DRAFT_220356 [Ceratobasidium sp. AG-I]